MHAAPTSAIAYGLATLAADGTILDTWVSASLDRRQRPAHRDARHLTPEEARAALGEHRCHGPCPGHAPQGRYRCRAQSPFHRLDEPPVDAH